MKHGWIGAVFFGVSSLMSASGAMAASPGGSSECGIGWSVTQKKSFFATSTRSTTHVFIPPTFGMSSGTSGCDSHSLVKTEENAARFIAGNEDAIRSDIAQGDGEYVQALTVALGCEGEAARRLAPALRENYDPAIESDAKSLSTGLELYLRVRASLRSDPVLARGCRVVADSATAAEPALPRSSL